MKSRMEKYYTEKPQYTRTTRNASLYKEVYGNYANLENLPIADNTNEIDLKDLQEIVNSNHQRKRRLPELDEEFEINNLKKAEEQREYDINKILEKAKSTNIPKEEPKKNQSPTYKFLTTLESQELLLTDTKKAEQKLEPLIEVKQDNLQENTFEEEIYMTRELKFKDKQLEVTREINLLQEQESSPLDLFEDLKPDDNSFVAEPIKVEKDNIFSSSLSENESLNCTAKAKKISGEETLDEQDISIIKQETFKNASKIDDDFYTSSYKFSKHDFIDEDDEISGSSSKGLGILKVIILLVTIFALTTIIYYFVNKYGIGV